MRCSRRRFPCGGLRDVMVKVIMGVVVGEVADDETGEQGIGGRVPKISVKTHEEEPASGMLTAGGMTRRRRSFGWSW